MKSIAVDKNGEAVSIMSFSHHRFLEQLINIFSRECLMVINSMTDIAIKQYHSDRQLKKGEFLFIDVLNDLVSRKRYKYDPFVMIEHRTEHEIFEIWCCSAGAFIFRRLMINSVSKEIKPVDVAFLDNKDELLEHLASNENLFPFLKSTVLKAAFFGR